MLTGPSPAPVVGALGLLERATGYTRTCLQLVTLEAMANRTPCRGWDLWLLLHHLDDSLAALQEAADVGYVDLDPDGDGCGNDRESADIGVRLRTRVSSLLGALSNNDGSTLVSVAGRPLTAGVLASTGALEIAVHGWDVARACGHPRPLPPRLAEELLELAPLLVSEQDRPARFATAVPVPPMASSGDQLLAFLRRRPWTPEPFR
jgi:uncharacterized protein (TIGR03086 family)